MEHLEKELLLKFRLLNKVKKFYVLTQLDKLLDYEIAETDLIWHKNFKKK